MLARIGCFAAVLLAVTLSANAQTTFRKPITIIVPAAAGGPIDTLTRIITEHMRQTLGQPILIENIGGGAGTIATSRLVRADPDGHTLMVGIWNTHVANAVVHKLPYDVQKDFTPVGLISYSGLFLVGRKNLPANDLKELIAWLKANSGQATAGTAGTGAVSHIGGVLLQRLTGTSFSFIPYRGLAPAMQDLVAERIDLMLDTPATSLPQLKAGTIRAYAFTAEKRLSAALDIPTAAEAGLPELNVYTWNAVFAPKGTPEDVVATLNAALRSALADAAIRARVAEIGQEIYPEKQQSPQALAALQKAELERWVPVIEAAGIKRE
jgi:tripartite-type tricarboxylate transporter receptor subunit TctC